MYKTVIKRWTFDKSNKTSIKAFNKNKIGVQGSTESEVLNAISVFTSVKWSGYRKIIKVISPLPLSLCDLMMEG